jgi:RNA polymerase sigma factor (sigma-70 family)
MTKIPPLNAEQKQLVETHLSLVKQVIHFEIITNETLYGFEYDDLYQEGCIYLCKAAFRYQPEKGASFSTFARKVVTNGLRTYCRIMCNKQKRLTNLIITAESNDELLFEETCVEDEWERIISQRDTMCLLGALKKQYKGSVRLGIEALEWKVKGFTGSEIAKMHGVKPNLVGAWISKAVKKLRKNSMFILWISQFPEYKQKLELTGK